MFQYVVTELTLGTLELMSKLESVHERAYLRQVK